jgi:peptide deformylase
VSGTRRIVLYPDPVLRRKAAPVSRVDQAVRDLVQDMFRIMRQEEGAGLAAPQIGESLRLFVTEERPDEGQPARAFINPQLAELAGDLDGHDEGCLSLPGIRGVIRRQPRVTIRALDEQGQPFELTSDQFSARVWQHEFDHLEGILITDRMAMLDRMRVRKALRELEADAEDVRAR